MDLSKLYKRSPVTLFFAAVCIIVFIMETFAGGSGESEAAFRFGAMYAPAVLDDKEYWRLFTAMFLHFGIEHLFSNMLALLAIGPYAEAFLGKVGFAFLYIASGLSGNLLSLSVDVFTNDFPLSCGASGCVCGVLGVFLVMAVTPGLKRIFPLKRVMLSIIVTLLPGLSDSGISMSAHVGGLIGGFLLSFIITSFRKSKRKLPG